MAFNNTKTNYAYGLNNALQAIPGGVTLAPRDPESTDRSNIGSMWINTDANTYFILTSAGTWTPQSEGSTTVATLDITGGAGTVLTVETGGNTVLGGDLSVAGATALNGTLLVQGAVTLNSQVDINSSSLIDIQSTSNTYPAIRIQTDGGASEGLLITSVQGEGSHATADPAISLLAVAGGIDIIGTKELFLQSDSTSANAIVLSTSAGSMRLSSANAVTVASTGAWSATSQAALSMSSVGNMTLSSTSNNDLALAIIANGGSQERISISSNLGTGTGSSSTAAVAILSVQGGMVVGAKKQIWLKAEHIGAQAIYIYSNSSSALDSIQIISDFGGIDIDADALIDINTTSDFVVSAGGAMTLGSIGAGSVSSNAGLTLESLTSGVTITNTGNVSINADNDYAVTATGTIDLAATGTSTISSDISVAITANNTGMISLQPKVVNTTALSSTNDAIIGKTILTNQTALFNSSLTVVISNTNITTTSAVLISASTYSPTSTGAVMDVRFVQVSTGSMTFELVNNSVGNLIVTDVINIAFQVL